MPKPTKSIKTVRKMTRRDGFLMNQAWKLGTASNKAVAGNAFLNRCAHGESLRVRHGESRNGSSGRFIPATEKRCLSTIDRGVLSL